MTTTPPTGNPTNLPADETKVAADDAALLADEKFVTALAADEQTKEATLATDTAQENADIAADLAPTPLTVTPIPAQSAQVGVPFKVTVVVTGGVPTILYKVNGIPAGLVQSGPVISGIPTTPTAAGSPAEVTVTVSDSRVPVPDTGIVTFPITIAAAAPPPPPPVVTPPPVTTPPPVVTPPPPATTTGKLIIGSFVQAGIAADDSLLVSAGLTPAKSAAMDFSYASGTNFASNASAVTELAAFPGPYKVFAEAMYWNGGGYDPNATLPFSNPTDTNYAAAKVYYTASAQQCLAAGINIIRLGWEFNGAFAGAAKAEPKATDFVRSWQFIYAIYDGVAVAAGKGPGFFSFQFCPDASDGNGSFGSGQGSSTVSDYYPGKAYMGNPGYLALDYYPSSSWPTFASWMNAAYKTNGGWGFQSMLDLAVANGHGLALGEWGSQSVDEPEAVTDMLAWAVNTALPALNGANFIAMMWAPSDTATKLSEPASSWGLDSEPNQWAALKTAIATYKASGVIAA